MMTHGTAAVAGEGYATWSRASNHNWKVKLTGGVIDRVPWLSVARTWVYRAPVISGASLFYDLFEDQKLSAGSFRNERRLLLY